MQHRVARIPKSNARSFRGTTYRFVNPVHSSPKAIVSGKGGLHAHGRWNLAGTFPVTYTSLDPETALAEVLGHVRYYRLPVDDALPRTLVSIQTRLSNVLDLTDGQLRRRLILGEDTIRNLDWRRENRRRREALTQSWGWAFQRAGFEAILVPSAANSKGVNLVVFPENLASASLFSPDSASN